MGARALSLDLVGSLMEAFHLLDGLKTIREPEIQGVYLILNRIKDDLLVSHGFSNTVVIIFLFILNPGDSARPFGMAGRRYVTGYRSFAPLAVWGSDTQPAAASLHSAIAKGQKIFVIGKPPTNYGCSQ